MSTEATPSAEPLKSVSKSARDRILGIRTSPEVLAAEKKTAEDAQAAEAAKVAAAAKTEEDKKAAEKPKPKEKPKAGPTLPDAPKPAEKSLADAVREVLPTITAAKPTPQANPEIEREIELAKFAERRGGDKFTGFGAKVADFFLAKDALVGEKAKELGGQQSAEFRDWLQGDEFKNWVDQNRPNYAGLKRKLEEDMVAERARIDAERAVEPKLKELERKQLAIQHGPMIQSLTHEALSKIILVDTSEEKDPALEGFRKNPNDFGAAHPDEARIIAQEAAHSIQLLQAVYNVDLEIEEPDQVQPVHKELGEFLRSKGAEMSEKYPNGIEMPDGKILVDGSTYAKHGLTKDPRYRTWTAHEIAAMIAAEGNAKILEKLRQRRDGVAKSIYARPAVKAEATPAGQANEKKPEPASPEATTSRAPGGPKKADEKKTLASRYA